MIYHLTRDELADVPVGASVTTRGKELRLDGSVRDALRFFAGGEVSVLPVLDGERYAGAVTRERLEGSAPDDPISGLAADLVPVATAGTPTAAALAELDAHGGRRLVVVGEDGSTYIGLVCLRSDRVRLCVDGERLHAVADGSQLVDGVPADAAGAPRFSPETLVADVVLAEPAASSVFERLGIDFCCRGRVPLAQACEARGVALADVLAELERAPRSAGASDVDRMDVPALAAHIVDAHHAYLRAELPELDALSAKVARVHGATHPELADARATFLTVAADLLQHMDEEEGDVFPACVALAEGDGTRAGSVAEAVERMETDHDGVARGLERLRDLLDGYAAPPDACGSYRALLDRLDALEKDVHLHVHKENNVLFPRALAAGAARK